MRVQPGATQQAKLERSAVVVDPAMVHTFELLRRLAASNLPVLIHGETGVGKENAAWAVHHWSGRSRRPFVGRGSGWVAPAAVLRTSTSHR